MRGDEADAGGTGEEGVDFCEELGAPLYDLIGDGFGILGDEDGDEGTDAVMDKRPDEVVESCFGVGGELGVEAVDGVVELAEKVEAARDVDVGAGGEIAVEGGDADARALGDEGEGDVFGGDGAEHLAGCVDNRLPALHGIRPHCSSYLTDFLDGQNYRTPMK